VRDRGGNVTDHRRVDEVLSLWLYPVWSRVKALVRAAARENHSGVVQSQRPYEPRGRRCCTPGPSGFPARPVAVPQVVLAVVPRVVRPLQLSHTAAALPAAAVCFLALRFGLRCAAAMSVRRHALVLTERSPASGSQIPRSPKLMGEPVLSPASLHRLPFCFSGGAEDRARFMSCPAGARELRRSRLRS